jgi:4a-hydroxytetrahydrobiopterin dehydratase
MAALNSQQVAERLKGLDGWTLAGGSRIEKTYSFKNYYETMAFVNALAWIAHQADHHPDLEVGYNKVKVAYSTHSVGGLSEKDFESAGKIDSLLTKS